MQIGSAQVVLIEYTYKNTADPEEMYIFDAHFVIDEGGTVCDTYLIANQNMQKKHLLGRNVLLRRFLVLGNIKLRVNDKL